MITTPAEVLSDDDGIGLIEIVVSMFLLALTMVAFIPLLVQGIQTAAKNAEIAAATQLVNQEIEQARALSASCLSLLSFGSVMPPAVTTDNITLQASRTMDPCPTTYPSTVSFTSSVSADGEVRSSAITEILVVRQ